jgi:type IV pilus assembly protein PilX
MFATANLPRAQAGNTLIIGVILLLLISLLVIAAGRGITLQTTMSGNSRERDVAFQAAEAALRDAESRIGVFHASFAGTGLITTSTVADFTRRSTADYWTKSTTAGGYGWYDNSGAVDTSKSLQTATTVAGVDQQPRYVVERLLPGGPTGSGTPCYPNTWYRYRVTTIAVGASTEARKSADTRVILQAEFRHCAP